MELLRENELMGLSLRMLQSSKEIEKLAKMDMMSTVFVVSRLRKSRNWLVFQLKLKLTFSIKI